MTGSCHFCGFTPQRPGYLVTVYVAPIAATVGRLEPLSVCAYARACRRRCRVADRHLPAARDRRIVAD